MNPIWFDVLSIRLQQFCDKAMSSHLFFDFMTIFRRLTRNKVLMDFDFIVVNGYEKEPDSRVAFEEYLTKLDHAFEAIHTETTLKDVQTSTYRLHKDGRVSFMEFFWAMMFWRTFGSGKSVHPMLIEGLYRRMRGMVPEQTSPNKVYFQAMVRPPEVEGDDESHDESVVELMFLECDRILVAIGESNFKPKLEEGEDLVRAFIH